jgi:hypothetical protein
LTFFLKWGVGMLKVEATFNKDQTEKFLAISESLYNKFAFFPINTTEKTITYGIGYIGEDEEEFYRFQETLMEHIDSITIEEAINKND